MKLVQSSITQQPSLQYVSPLPDLPTGIAQYSRDLLDAVDGSWNLRVFSEKGSRPRHGATTQTTNWISFDPSAPTIYQVGNSEFHEQATERLLIHSGVVVLHDTVLHHSRFSQFVRSGKSRDYLKEIQTLYGSSGAEIAGEFLSGRIPENVAQYPLSESIITSARAVAVHNQLALLQVKRLNPDALVRLIPMGIPLPSMIAKTDARKILKIPESTFLIVSVSHINPHKRIPVVLRAVRRVRERVSDTRCIIAGTPAPGLGYEGLITMLGLNNTVQMPGYVPDETARLLVAASDVCINLRYPSNGETSASMLRMLGAGRPVVVTEGVTSEELPEGVGIKIPVDRFEEEMLAEVLLELSTNEMFRIEAGQAGRRYVEEFHTVQHMSEGYRHLIAEVYGINLTQLPSAPIEDHISLDSQANHPMQMRKSIVEQKVDRAIGELGLEGSDEILCSVAEAIVDLNLDRLPRSGQQGDQNYRQFDVDEVLDRLQCPSCLSSLRHEQDQLICNRCLSVYSAENGTPMLTPPQVGRTKVLKSLL